MSDTPSRRTFWALTLGVIAFTVYGSLVPFKFHARPLDEAIDAAQWVVEHRSGIQSRSDFVANVILGVPLGFCLLAACRLDKSGGKAIDLAAVFGLWPLCILFAAAVEFSQLFFYERTCSASDVIAQSLGSLTGMFAWIVVGDRFVRVFRRVWQGDRIGGTAGRILVVYVGMLAIVQWLPLDLTLSPAELYHKNFDDATKIVIVPFSESGKLPTWLELAALYIPAGLLVGCMRKTTQIGSVALGGFLLAVAMEAGQLFVKSRTTSNTDIWLGASGFYIGFALTRSFKTRDGRGLTWNTGLLLVQAWVALILVINWWPFDFNNSIIRPRLAEVNWVPFAAAYEKNYLSSLEEAAAKTLLFTPLGAALAAIGLRRNLRKRTAFVLGLLVAALAEAGQLALPGRVPGPTDLIFGSIGAWLGCAAALRIRAFANVVDKPKAVTNFVRFKVS